MKLIIDIPKHTYESIKEYYDKLGVGTAVDVKVSSIAEGIPLPKRHGRLIDADALIDSFELADFDGDEYSCIDNACSIVNSISAIIEADKAESEE